MQTANWKICCTDRTRTLMKTANSHLLEGAAIGNILFWRCSGQEATKSDQVWPWNKLYPGLTSPHAYRKTADKYVLLNLRRIAYTFSFERSCPVYNLILGAILNNCSKKQEPKSLENLENLLNHGGCPPPLPPLLPPPPPSPSSPSSPDVSGFFFVNMLLSC